MEAALRTAYFKLTGNESDKIEYEPVFGQSGIREASFNINGITLNIAVVNGIGNVEPVLKEIEEGKSKYHFVEVMSCPGGCINGGGQPIHNKPEKIIKRMKALYRIDENASHRSSHENESVKILYKEFFNEPNSEKAHAILHTKYFDRKNVSVKISNE